MKTLLDKVKKLEEEVVERLLSIERAGQEQMRDLKEAEPKVLADIKKKAERRGAEIVREAESAAQAEVSVIKEDERHTLAAVHKQAAVNQEAAVQFGLQMFREMYEV